MQQALVLLWLSRFVWLPLKITALLIGISDFLWYLNSSNGVKKCCFDIQVTQSLGFEF